MLWSGGRALRQGSALHDFKTGTSECCIQGFTNGIVVVDDDRAGAHLNTGFMQPLEWCQGPTEFCDASLAPDLMYLQ